MEVSNETLELIETRLADRVARRVRGYLFALYGFVGTAILAVLGYVGYDIVDGLRDNARDFARDAVAESVADANQAARQAKDVAAEAYARLDVLNDHLADGSRRLGGMESEVNSTLAQLERARAEIDRRMTELGAELDEIDTRITEQQERARELYAGAGNLESLKGDLATLTEKVAALEERMAAPAEAPPMRAPIGGAPPVSEVPDGGAPAGADGPDAADDKFQQLAQRYDRIQREQSAPPPETTVYFQFAGVAREAAQRIRARLAERGYTVPGEERIASAAGLSEIRYFFPEDEERARKLRADLAQVLSAAGYEETVTLKDFSDYKAAKPRPGTVELWLEPVPRG